MQNWKSDREYALRLLGYGLHAIQDISALGQMGRGKKIPVQTVNADEIDYVWANKEHTRVKKNSKEKTRLEATQTATRKYLVRFINAIGGKNKVKS